MATIQSTTKSDAKMVPKCLWHCDEQSDEIANSYRHDSRNNWEMKSEKKLNFAGTSAMN